MKFIKCIACSGTNVKIAVSASSCKTRCRDCGLMSFVEERKEIRPEKIKKPEVFYR